MFGGKVGVGIISFDRPNYLWRLLDSLEGQEGAGEIDLHFFQDGEVNEFSGRVCGFAEGIALSVEVFERARLPNKCAHVREKNAGIAIQQFEAIEEMVAEYDHVLILEDDVVLSPYHFRLMRVLFEQLEDEEDVFGFCLGLRKLCPKHKVEENLDKMYKTRGEWGGEGFWARTWARVRPHFVEYYRLVEEIDYVYRRKEEILQLFRRKGWPAPVSSQDAGRDMAIHAAGMQRVRSVVNRAILVGEYGMNLDPQKFRMLGFHDQEPFVFESDKHLQEFKWIR